MCVAKHSTSLCPILGTLDSSLRTPVGPWLSTKNRVPWFTLQPWFTPTIRSIAKYVPIVAVWGDRSMPIKYLVLLCGWYTSRNRYFGVNPKVPGSWPIHSWSPWRSSLTDLSLLKPRSEISWPIPDTLQPTSETTWLLRVDLSNPTIARDSLVQSTKHRKKTCFQKASSVTFPQVSSVSTFRLLNYKYEMHLNCPTPRFDCPRKKPKLPSSSPGPPDSRAFSWRSQIIGQIIGIHWRKYPSKYGIFMGFWWDSSMIS